jgi:hypothetical protein
MAAALFRKTKNFQDFCGQSTLINLHLLFDKREMAHPKGFEPLTPRFVGRPGLLNLKRISAKRIQNPTRQIKGLTTLLQTTLSR